MERGERSIISNFLGKDSGKMGLLGDRHEGKRRDVRLSSRCRRKGGGSE